MADKLLSKTLKLLGEKLETGNNKEPVELSKTLRISRYNEPECSIVRQRDDKLSKSYERHHNLQPIVIQKKGS